MQAGFDVLQIGRHVLETCAADGSCQMVCPVGIDTGKLVKELRERSGAAHLLRIGLDGRLVRAARRVAARVDG